MAQDVTTPTDPGLVPWIVVEDAKHELHDILVNPQLVAFEDGVLVACFQHGGRRGAAPTQHLFRSDDRGLTWKSTSLIEGIADASLFVHDDALWILGQDAESSSNGEVIIRRSKDLGLTWTTPASASQGLLRGKGLGSSIASPTFMHGGRIWRPFTHFVVSEGAAHHSVLVASADLRADLLQASSWRWSSEFPLSFQPVSFCTLVEVEDAKRLVLMVAGAGDHASRASVSADGWRLSPSRIDDEMSLPETANGARVIRDSKSDRSFVLTAEERSVVGETDARRNNVLSLCDSTFLMAWTSVGDLLHDAGGTRYSFAWSDSLVDGEDLLVLLSVTFVGDKETQRPWERKIVFLRVPKFRERTSSSQPLWGPTVPR